MDRSRLREFARLVGDDWKHGAYYDEAERSMDSQWNDIVWPIIRDCDFSTTLELAAGHGRNSEKLRHLADHLILVDINQENIDFLKDRFNGTPNVSLMLNDGASLPEVHDESISFVYSFDSMVHFDSDVVRAYLNEFSRVLVPGGAGFCHYSNYTGSPTGTYRDHPGWRNFMSRELFEHYAVKEGLIPVTSRLVDWTRDGSFSDAVTLFRKPVSAPDSGASTRSLPG